MLVFGSVPLRCSPSVSVFWDNLDHGRSNEPMNPCPEWIHWFIILIYHDPSDHRSLILIWIIPKERTLYLHVCIQWIIFLNLRYQGSNSKIHSVHRYYSSCYSGSLCTHSDEYSPPHCDSIHWQTDPSDYKQILKCCRNNSNKWTTFENQNHCPEYIYGVKCTMLTGCLPHLLPTCTCT